jgi:hypothetical protein
VIAPALAERVLPKEAVLLFWLSVVLLFWLAQRRLSEAVSLLTRAWWRPATGIILLVVTARLLE